MVENGSGDIRKSWVCLWWGAETDLCVIVETRSRCAGPRGTMYAALTVYFIWAGNLGTHWSSAEINKDGTNNEWVD